MNAYKISNPEPSELEPTLELAFAHIPLPERAARLDALMSMLRADPSASQGVFQAQLGDKRIGALFSFQRPDGAVLLWAPTMLDGFSTTPLFDPLERFCRSRHAKLAIALMDRHQPANVSELRAAGFEYQSDMLYLVLDAGENIATKTGGHLEFVPLDPTAATMDSMVEIVQKTYRNSRDFPRLLSQLPVREVLAGYQTVATFDPALWFFIREADRSIGALLLTDQPEDQLELTYMGLAEEARGHGFGAEIVGFAQNIAQQRGRRYLLTSVDEQNPAALKSYLSAGMNVWDRKSVFVRFLDESP